MQLQRFLILFFLSTATLSAHAFERPFPATAKRAEMTPANYPSVVINGKARTLSAGARIWNQDNTIEMPAALRGNKILVHYTEHETGEIDRIWILTPDEIKQPPPKPLPNTAPLPSSFTTPGLAF